MCTLARKGAFCHHPVDTKREKGSHVYMHALPCAASDLLFVHTHVSTARPRKGHSCSRCLMVYNRIRNLIHTHTAYTRPAAKLFRLLTVY